MFFRHTFLAIVWGLLILLLSALPGQEFPDMSFWSLLSFDKVVHAFFYAVLVELMIVGFIKQYTFRRLRFSAVTVSMVFGIFYGGVIEFLQATVFTGRQGDVMDWIADTIGCLIGMLVFYAIYGRNIIANKN